MVKLVLQLLLNVAVFSICALLIWRPCKVCATQVPQACANPDTNLGVISSSVGFTLDTLNTASANSNRVSTCVQPSSNDYVFKFSVSQRQWYTIETILVNDASGDADTVLQINSCADGLVVACNDDGYNQIYSAVTVDLQSGTYIASVSNYFASSNGVFKLRFTPIQSNRIQQCTNQCGTGACLSICTDTSIQCSSSACTSAPTSRSPTSPPVSGPVATQSPTSASLCTDQGLCQVQQCEANARSCITSINNGVTIRCSDCPPSSEALQTACRNITAGQIAECSDVNNLCQSYGQGEAVFYDFSENGGSYKCSGCLLGGTIESFGEIGELPPTSIGLFIGAWIGVVVGALVIGLGVAFWTQRGIVIGLKWLKSVLLAGDKTMSLGRYLIANHPLAIWFCCVENAAVKHFAKQMVEHVVFTWINPFALSLVFASNSVKQSCQYEKTGGSTITISSSNQQGSNSLYDVSNLAQSILTTIMGTGMEIAFQILLVACFRGLETRTKDEEQQLDSLGMVYQVLLKTVGILAVCGASGGLLAYAIILITETSTDANKFALAAVIFVVAKLADFIFFCFFTNSVRYMLIRLFANVASSQTEPERTKTIMMNQEVGVYNSARV